MIAGLNLETLNTILSGTNNIGRYQILALALILKLASIINIQKRQEMLEVKDYQKYN